MNTKDTHAQLIAKCDMYKLDINALLKMYKKG